MKQCKECGGDFKPENSKGVFCSVKCKQKDYRKSIAGKLKMLDELTKSAKETPLGKEIMEKVKNTPSKMTVRDISPNGEIKKTFNLQPKEEKSNMPDPKDKVAYLKWLRSN